MRPVAKPSRPVSLGVGLCTAGVHLGPCALVRPGASDWASRTATFRQPYVAGWCSADSFPVVSLAVLASHHIGTAGVAAFYVCFGGLLVAEKGSRARANRGICDPNPLSCPCFPLGVSVGLLESHYQHDSLRYLLDYFVPAKHLLYKLQQHACHDDDGGAGLVGEVAALL
ncbi:unnamed protein product [Boreogadus saida]